jgi:hypothetical protein
MARTAVQRSITFDPSSRLTDFLGVGYSTTGVAVAPLTSLSPIYPSCTILQLSLLKQKVSARTQRAGDPDVDIGELALVVVMFKKINNKNLPPGLTVVAFSSFFTDFFTYQTSEEKHAFKTNIASLLVNPNYHVLAITVPLFDVQDPSKLLTHFIVGAALFMYDNKRGSYINCLGVVDKGTSGVCMLNGSYFVEPSTSNLLSDTASFRALGIGTFLLSCLQVLGSLAYKSPIVARSDPFQLACHERVMASLPLIICIYKLVWKWVHRMCPTYKLDLPTFLSKRVAFVVPTSARIVLSMPTNNPRPLRMVITLTISLCGCLF